VANGEPLKNIRVVLCEPGHPGNIGAVARAMKTMGLASLYLVNPQRYPDPEAEWRASRATDVLAGATICGELSDALHGVAYAIACTARTREIAVPAETARAAATRAVEIAATQQVALVFGNETYGLTGAQVNACDLIASIPANPEYPSLNLGAAVQVLAYEVRMAALSPSVSRTPRVLATHEETERLFDHLEAVMGEIGFLDPRHPKKLMPRLRRLFARAELEHEEVNILRGLLKAFRNPIKRS
jgi:tRNA/rRNA methyltransferase